MTNPRILVVDDDEKSRALVRVALEREGFSVLEAGDGAEALEVVTRESPDLVVLDVNLPTVNGLEACRQITSHTPRARVIVISAMTDEAITQAAELAGAAYFFNKGAMGDELILAIKQAWEDVT